MGIPAFHKWLVKKYPKIVERAIEEKGEKIDTSSPNPNGMEFDNLYLDMMNIFYLASPADDDDCIFPPKLSVYAFINSILKYIDRLFNIVRPRKILYMAIDGVPPRSKMNEQRSGRFRSTKKKEIAKAEEQKLRSEFEREGKPVLPKQESKESESLGLYPGSKFLFKLSKALQQYICSRMKNDAGWKNVKVILSDANVPGEGEHKIMTFIRNQRNHPSYNPNTRHCLYGSDADVIMLSLGTHELHFSILREDFLVQEKLTSNASLIKNPYQFLHIWILREYLELDMQIEHPPEKFEFDTERIIDDFIFICFFLGNDFIPQIPTLQIQEGGIELLMAVYKAEFKKMGGYLVDMNLVDDKKMDYIKLERVERFILSVGAYEEKIFTKRSKLQERSLMWFLRDHADDQDEDEEGDSGTMSLENTQLSNEAQNLVVDHSEMLKNTIKLYDKLEDRLCRNEDLFKNRCLLTDKVRLGNPGYKERYYKEKFSAEKPEEIENARKAIIQKYAEGLLWVLQCYFFGIPSWSWFYPYHYGPFASDFKGLSGVQVKFQKGSPFKPFDQLVVILPGARGLPEPYRKLTTEESNIFDFYPKDFEIDTDGKRFMWQGIIKLPFIDETRLLAETRKVEKDLGEEEAIRNGTNENQLFVRSTTNLGLQILSFIQRQNSQNTCEIDTSDGISGIIRLVDSTSPAEFEEDTVLCVFYELPDCCPLVPLVLAGVEYPEKTIFESDIMKTTLWHEYEGSRPHTTCRSNNRRWSNSNSESVEHFQYSRWTSSSNDRWNGAGSNQSLSGGMQHLRISGKTQQANNNSCSSRNSLSYNTNNDHWRQTNHASSSSQGQGRGAIPGSSRNTSNNFWSSGSRWDPNSSTQAHWRSENVPRERWDPNSSTQAHWRSENVPRECLDPNSSTQAHWRRENVPRERLDPNSSTQTHWRSENVPRERWDLNSSTQAHWRSENVPRDQSSRWTPRGGSSQSSATKRQNSRW